jgi:hypothetical protein
MGGEWVVALGECREIKTASDFNRKARKTRRWTLPAPLNDTPEARAARDEAMAVVTNLRPGNAFEARLPVDAVAADAHAGQPPPRHRAGTDTNRRKG